MAGFRGVFELAASDVDRFEGKPANEGGTRVYGGHPLTQGWLACFRTFYSLHAQFCRIGRPDQSSRMSSTEAAKAEILLFVG